MGVTSTPHEPVLALPPFPDDSLSVFSTLAAALAVVSRSVLHFYAVWNSELAARAAVAGGISFFEKKSRSKKER